MYHPRFSNCLLFSLINKLLFGGKFKCTRILPFPHFYWTDKNGNLWNYVPLSRVGEDDKYYLDTPIIFEGVPINKSTKKLEEEAELEALQ